MKKDYLAVLYDKNEVPFTAYPNKLTKHLKNIFNIKQITK